MTKTVSFSPDTVNIFFHILTRCNLHCRHCYINPDQHGTATLPLNTINAWMNAFGSKIKQANIIFLGGEPTLHPDLSSAIKSAGRIGCQSITVDTNGYLFNDILLKVEPDELNFISFSLDGATPQTNDRLRGKGSYDTCIAGIKKAIRKGFHTSLIYTVSRHNINELEQMIPLVKDLGIDRFFIQVIGIRGKSAGNDAQKLQLTADRWLNVIPPVAEKIAASGIVVTYPKVFLSSEEKFECAGLCAENYFIFPNGRVYRCPLCEDYPLHSLEFCDNHLIERSGLTEKNFFSLDIPEGCVMNKLIQPENISYGSDGKPEFKIACCMLKKEVRR